MTGATVWVTVGAAASVSEAAVAATGAAASVVGAVASVNEATVCVTGAAASVVGASVVVVAGATASSGRRPSA